jgi:membrane protein implicated in regulation of membrane protease activity
MEPTITHEEAEGALATVDLRRRRVIEEIGLPGWYWWGLALGWIAVGVASDSGVVWLAAAATLIFGAVHAAVVPRVASGRHRSQRLSVKAELAGRRTAVIVVLAVAALGLVTVAAGFALSADGAHDPSIIASIFVAVLILLGGPRLLQARRPQESAG